MSFKSDWSNLIALNSKGLHIASYNEIRDSIAEKYKEIYGSDIVISDTCADGIFINEMALMFNNIFQSFKIFYDNMKLETASGTYLDNLCALSNIYRYSATKSAAQLIVTNVGDSPIKGSLDFVDVNGQEWVWDNTDRETIEPGSKKNIIVKCKKYGEIKAKAGTIRNLINSNLAVTIVQESDAVPGYGEEEDYSLRMRKKQYNLVGATSTLESLYNELYRLDGIEDIYIYNNNSDSEKILSDGAKILGHDIYIAIRQRYEGVISDRRIADIIYNYLTPGIRSYFSVSSSDSVLKGGNAKNYSLSIEGIDSRQNIMWKEVSSTTGSITVVLNVNPSFSNETLNSIANNVKDYLNSLTISDIVKLKESKDDTDLRFAIMGTLSSSSYFINTISGFDTLLSNCNISYLDIKGNVEVVSADKTRTITIS